MAESELSALIELGEREGCIELSEISRVTEALELDDEGMLRVPTGPGLGVKLNWDAVGRYTR